MRENVLQSLADFYSTLNIQAIQEGRRKYPNSRVHLYRPFDSPLNHKNDFK